MPVVENPTHFKPTHAGGGVSFFFTVTEGRILLNQMPHHFFRIQSRGYPRIGDFRVPVGFPRGFQDRWD